MRLLLTFSRAIDAVNERLGWLANVLVLLACLISAGNAMSRYAFDLSSNAWLEIQWYLFAAVVMFGAPIVLKLNEHVRVDLLYGKLRGNGPVYVDLFGLVFFLMPAMLLIAWLSWPLLVNMYVTNEMSSNAGGLIRWPAMLTLPLGFALMALQGLAEIIKRVAYLRGLYAMSTHYEAPVQ
ncbi:MAG: TRAP transporter small permease subunit [Burkholderiaceae bacterium]